MKTIEKMPGLLASRDVICVNEKLYDVDGVVFVRKENRYYVTCVDGERFVFKPTDKVQICK